MTFDQVKSMIVASIKTPAIGAQQVLSVDLPRAALWTALTLLGVLNGMYYGMILPGAAQAGVIPAGMANAPFVVTGAILIILALMVHLLVFTGRILGGTATIDAMLKVVVWLQGLRLLAQVVISVLSLAIPPLGWLVAMAVGVWGLWMMIVFIATAHNFTPIKGLGTLLGTFVAAIFALSILSAILGLGTPTGEI
ncbi:YIP1 family protein [Pseudooceanicola sp. MF1-13]|uniref:YIP1 family protein n=1 Tax=Pseudooceanicola sp. MF1-13 TaxID=3379095 RepID=UPI0038919DE3